MKRTAGTLALLGTLAACAAIVPRAVEPDSIDLAGTWDLAFDDAGRGEAERWFDVGAPGAARAPWGFGKVPGCFPAPGGGAKHPDGEHAVGWYRKTVDIPEAWRGKRIRIRFDAVERNARAFLNGVEIGAHAGGWAPFSLDATAAARPGAENALVVRVEHRERATRGFVELVGANYAGVWQGARIEAKDDLTLEDFRVRTRVSPPFADLEVLVRNAGDAGARFTVSGRVEGAGERTVSLFVPGRSKVPVRLPIEIAGAELWEPAHPRLYEGSVVLERDGREVDRVGTRFGLREVRADGNRILLNGRPIEFRGVLHWGWYPDLLAPAPDEATARAELAAIRSLGFNAVKPCLVVFPEAYYRAADEAGVLVWQEYPNWQIRVNDANRDALVAEFAEMAARLRHHPSIVLSSLATEWDKRYYDEAFAARAFEAVKAAGPDALLLDNSGGWSGPPPRPLGWSKHGEFASGHPYPNRLRGFDAAAAVRTREKPFLLGETIDGDTFKNLPAVLERNGGAPPWWMKPHQVDAVPTMPPALFERMEQLSKRQVLAYRKHLTESFRALPDLSGFVVTHIHDVIDTASGLLDEARKPKWAPDEFLPFNGETAVFLDAPRRTFIAGEKAEVRFAVRHSGTAPLRDARIEWKGPGDSTGAVPLGAVAPGAVARTGPVTIEMAGAPPFASAIEATLVAGDLRASNRWKVWVFARPSDPARAVVLDDARGALAGLPHAFPAVKRLASDATEVPAGTDLVVAAVPSEATRRFVRAGGRLLLLGADAVPRRRAFFRRESVTAIGRHPALGNFPHEGFPDLQFVRLEPEFAVDLDGEPGLVGIAPRIDCRTLRQSDAWIVEAKVDEGGVLVAAFDFGGLAEDEPATAALAESLIRYASSPLFQPIGRLSPLGEKVWLDPDLYADRDGDRAMRRGPFVRSWVLCGPFDNAKSGWGATYPPEMGFDARARYPDGFGGEVGWTRHESPGDLVDLAAVWPGADRVASYAFARFESEVETDADLWVGSDDGERVWWNGELVLDRSDHREPHPDQDRARVRVRRGTNEAMLRVCDANHRLGFWFRLAVPDGTAAPRVDG